MVAVAAGRGRQGKSTLGRPLSHGRTSDPHCPGYSCTVSGWSDEETHDPLYAGERAIRRRAT